MEDLLKCHGRKFRGKICGRAVEGRISISKNWIYLCQNVVNGANAPDKLGYKFSWAVYWDMRESQEQSLRFQDVSDFELICERVVLIETTHFLTI